MGDHADDCLNAGMDALDFDEPTSYHDGDCSEFDDTRCVPVASRSLGTCRYCHKPNLEWRDTKWGKRLFDGDVFHTCPEYKQSKASAKPQPSQDDLVPALQRLTDAVNRLHTVTSSLRDEMNRFYNAKYGEPKQKWF